MDYKNILYEKKDRVATITLNRPEKLNALTRDMVYEWSRALRDARLDGEVKVVMVTGAGKAFCAGADLRGGLGLIEAFNQDDLPIASEYRNWLRDSIHLIPREVALLDKPYIAVVNGAAVGAGMDMASMCDMRFASENAQFSMGYVRVGIIPGDGGCYYLPRIVGLAKSLELIWTGEIIDAQESLRIGYVSRVISPEKLLGEARSFAFSLCSGPDIAIQISKRLIYRGMNQNIFEALEQADNAMSIILSTRDAREGLFAFLEKRRPNFLGK